VNQNHKDIMMDIFGTMDLNSPSGRLKLITNYNEYDSRLTELEEIYNDSDCKEIRKCIIDCHLNAFKLYNYIIYSTISKFVEEKYGHSLDFVILNYSQSEIISKLEEYLSKKGYPNSFKNDVYLSIKDSAERLDKRFSFDEVALINLIEASCGNNIYTEQGKSMNVRTGDNKYVIRTEKGYEYKRTCDTKTLDDGRTVFVKNRRTSDNEVLLNPLGSTRQELDKIKLDGFPLGNKLLSNTDNAMKKVMSNLFENLELCIETYNTIYCSGNNIVDNIAYLSDGTTFDFSFIVNEVNIPHLLGIPRPQKSEVSQESINILNAIRHNGYPALSLNSSSLDLLKFLRVHQNEIIDLGGLYESNGKKYEILNWEKMILKSTSFMKGDFFKTCFCLAQVTPNKSLQGTKYVSITSTEYNKGISTSITSSSVLNDLLNTVRKKRDFIFRGFGNDKGINYIKTIMTGKSETIRVESNNELIKTLQRYRDLFITGSSGWGMTSSDPRGRGGQYFDDSIREKDELLGSIVEEVVNEKYIKTFSPEEQAELGLSISRNLYAVPTISSEAIDVLHEVQNYTGSVTQQEVDEFKNIKGGSRKK
jgi:hypothetical protein